MLRAFLGEGIFRARVESAEMEWGARAASVSLNGQGLWAVVASSPLARSAAAPIGERAPW